MSLPEFSVRQVVLVNVLFAVCLLAGFISYQRTPVDFFPDISFNAAAIATLWTGASADEVERLVTTKIEDEIEDIEGIKEIRSFSSANSSQILVEWDETLEDAEYESAFNDLRAAVDRVPDLPPDAEEPVIRELSIAEVYASVQVVVADTGGLGPTVLLEVARDVQSRLEDVPGVEKVVIRGAQDREIRVVVDRDAAARHALTVVQVAERIRRKNLNLPAGTFTTSRGEATLRATGDYESIGEIAQTIVKDNPNGTHVRLAEIARVEEGIEKRRFYGRYNGHPALVMGIAKEDDAQLLSVVQRVTERVEQYRALLPMGLELNTTWDTSRWVASRMGVLWDNLVAGFFVVGGILWFTIGFRNALLTIVAIPFSFLTALVLFPAFDLTINSMSLVGMLLVSGMLVDDAIIVLENIYRRIEEGEELRRAVVQGTQEVLWPVVSAVSTTCAAFFPLLLITGTSGEFMSIFPKTVIVCLIASLFECLVILPAHYLDWGSRHAPGQRSIPGSAARTGLFALAARVEAAADGLHVRVDAGLARLRDAYLRALDVVLANRGAFAALALSLFLLALGLATHLPVQMFAGEFDNLFVIYEAPTDYGLDQTNELVRRVEREALDPLLGEHLVDYSTYVGNSLSADMDARISSNVGVSFGMIADTPRYRVAPEEAVQVVQEALDRYRAENPQVPLELRAMAPRNGPPLGKPVAVRIQADDYLLAKGIARELEDYLRTIEGVTNIEDNLLEGQREVRLVMDRQRAGQHGLEFEDLARALRGANDGLVASSFRDPAEGEDFDIRVLLDPRFRRDEADLLQAEVLAPGGYLVRLGDVADLEVARGFVSLAHYDTRRAVTVYADVVEGVATSEGVNRALAERFGDLEARFPEVEVVYGGEFQAQSEAFADMARVFPIALIIIYMILAAQFRSYLQPIIVCSAIPFGLIGVIFGVGSLGYSVSFGMIYATIGMSGVVVNDSLVMVDFINRARREGVPLLEAVRQSGARRLRPILLTTLTTAGALLPMALGMVGASKSWGPFAASVAFGLTFAMVGTLFIVPLAYTSLIVAQQHARARVARLRGRPEEVPVLGAGGS